MKQRVFIFSILLVAVSSLVFANGDSCEKIKNTLELAICVSNQFKTIELTLQKAENRFLKVLSSLPEGFHLLEFDFRKSSDAWRETRDASCSLESDIEYPPLPDSGRAHDYEKSIWYNDCRIKETLKRIQIVERWRLNIETWKNIDLP